MNVSGDIQNQLRASIYSTNLIESFNKQMKIQLALKSRLLTKMHLDNSYLTYLSNIIINF